MDHDRQTPVEDTQDTADRHSPYVAGAREERPWGSWEVLAVGLTYCVKRIVVRAGHRLSLQRHQHREERWVVVCGIGDALVGDLSLPAVPGAVFTIPSNTWHRLSARDDSSLVLVEVQTGACMEEDIERRDDDYGRI